MALTPRLELKQSQSLVMTPQLQQAIRLLQYSNMELVDFVIDEVEKNPLLEMGEANDQSQTPGESERDESEKNGKESEAVTSSDEYLSADTMQGSESDTPLDTDYENVFNNDTASDEPLSNYSDSLSVSGSGMSSGGSFEDMDFSLEQRVGESTTLRDHLEDQLNMIVLPTNDKLILQYLIGSLDESGYLTEDIDLIAERFGCSTDEIERVLAIAQTFDPIGVFARNLSECLKIQQRELDRLDPAMEALLDNLELLAKRDFNALKRLCRVDTEDLRDMIGEIQSLNPRPGSLFGGEVVQTVVPDVFIRKSPKGEWFVELNSETLPRVLLNNRYHTVVKEQARNKEEKEYLAECMASANWLVKALDQRARTILKVSSELVRQQSEFFEKGIKFLRPLNLKTIAEAIDMHESTVSRVTANKYIATNRGIFEMKYFFTTAISSMAEGDVHSAEAVKHSIKSLIDEENPKKILSDDKLVELLKAEGIDIARRTVAKYREALNIPSSIQRRRIKNSAL
ncbi:RNA polymerase factor sigma-54 [Emcibacter nanhaiensis]|uniref:RNA polymerase sigma-54 factor n=1 Tax=Emcibacter nanhaiensis TaxID=1505037 RepID=A0A501PB71_9PROT|nr:RNA polymerase factor sigma-54 [Emcibacter nanhaiensis]TPD57438.1 RNA polymerase factor sigma-54 [Emcibacter nanhaiensis]